MRIRNTDSNVAVLKELGQRIKDIRIARSMTQNELCEKSGVSFATIARIEGGEASNINNLLRIMRVLGLVENFELLIPEQEQLPEDLFQKREKRKRASKPKKENVKWEWGDEKDE